MDEFGQFMWTYRPLFSPPVQVLNSNADLPDTSANDRTNEDVNDQSVDMNINSTNKGDLKKNNLLDDGVVFYLTKQMNLSFHIYSHSTLVGSVTISSLDIIKSFVYACIQPTDSPSYATAATKHDIKTGKELM